MNKYVVCIDCGCLVPPYRDGRERAPHRCWVRELRGAGSIDNLLAILDSGPTKIGVEVEINERSDQTD